MLPRPLIRQELGELGVRRLGDVGEDASEVGLRVEAMTFGRGDERKKGSGTFFNSARDGCRGDNSKTLNRRKRFLTPFSPEDSDGRFQYCHN
jgi:hypothetical protein